MKYPYLLTSDQHCHNWTQFADATPDGVNTRLAIILSEMVRAHSELANAGGDTSFYAGDLFHVRGKIEPSVFNPTFDTIKGLHKGALTSYAIPGNHDLEGKHADKLGNAMQQLGGIPGFNVCVEPTWIGDVLVIPWFQDLNDLRRILEQWSDKHHAAKAGYKVDKLDVIIHAPVNGVIKGIPEHGLEAEELAAYGFRRVFAGHYHDHRVFCDGKVISVGATTHQTWNDPGSKAGFLLVYEDHIEHFETMAPLFVDLHTAECDSMDELANICVGNYVRLKTGPMTNAEKTKLQEELLGAGARGVNILPEPKKAVSRTETTVAASKSLEASTAEYIETVLKPTFIEDTQKLCADLIAQARSAA